MAKTKGTTKSFRFTLILAGSSDLTEEIETALHEAGCDDALLGSRDGVLFLDFDREAPSLGEAIISAAVDVRKSGAGVRIVRVEPDDLVTAAEIARRLGRSRESIRQLVQGERGPGTFPAPVANLTSTSPIWRWTEVAEWFHSYAGGSPATERRLEEARVIAALNAAVELARHVRDPGVVRRLWQIIDAGPPPKDAPLALALGAPRRRPRK